MTSCHSYVIVKTLRNESHYLSVKGFHLLVVGFELSWRTDFPFGRRHQKTLIFFVSKFWEDVKRYRMIKASLEGINAVSSGLVIAATLYLLEPIPISGINYWLIFGTFGILFFTKIPAPFVILAGLIMGFVIS